MLGYGFGEIEKNNCDSRIYTYLGDMKATAKSNVYSAEVNSQVDKIMSALNEANEIHSGRKKGTSFDEFLKEL